ncbi:MAG: phosphatidylglycerophosphatase A [Pseudomonadota bacterium]
MNKLKPRILPLPPGAAFTNPSVLISTWFGAGLLRPAPGTIGSLAAIPFGYGIVMLMGNSGLLLCAILLLIVATRPATLYGKKSGVTDDQSIVVDEVVGMWIAAIPAGLDLRLWLVAFLLFRLFDIWKPWPASFYDKRSRGGFDVMMDDVVAGIYALPGVSIAALAVASV